MKMGDTVVTIDGSTGKIVKVYYRSSAGSTCYYVASVDILLDSGSTINTCADLVSVMNR